MNRIIESSILAAVGSVAVTAAVTGLAVRFVKPGLTWYLVAAGAVLLLMAVHGILGEALSAPAPSDDRTADGHHGLGGETVDAEEGHAHDHVSRVGWLMLVPFLLIGFVVPPPLGAYSAGRSGGEVRKTSSAFAPLPSGDPVELTLTDYSQRVLYDDSGSLEGRRVRLVGFASPGRDGGWVLTRMAMSCCAADAAAIKVVPDGAQSVPADTWVAIEGTPLPAPEQQGNAPRLAHLKVEQLTRVSVPTNPYDL